MFKSRTALSALRTYKPFPISLWAALLILLPPVSANAFELSGGVSLGGFQAGTVPRLALSPHIGTSWHIKRDLVLTLHDLCSILPPIYDAEIGVFNKTSIAIGYASEKATFSVGPALSFYYIPACGLTLCGRVVGVAPGGHAQTDVYLSGPLGVSVNANVHWVGGRSLVLPGGLAVMVVAGPVLRWSTK